MPDGSQRPVARDTPSVLAARAERHPDRPAVLAPGRPPLSYGALAAQQDHVRRFFAERGIGPGDAVALHLPQGPEMAVATAVLPAAATAVPMDPMLQRDDYERLFIRLGAKALLLPRGAEHTARGAAERMGLLQIGLVADPAAPCGVFELRAESEPAARPDQRRHPADTAFILMSSGTTAARKLIPNRHAHILDQVRAMDMMLDFRPDDVGLHLAPMHFASAVKSSLLAPLLSGTTIACPPPYRPDAFFHWLDDCRPTWFRAGFTVLRDILQQADAHRAVLGGRGLRFIVSSSGRLEDDEIHRLEDVFQAPVIVGLGCSEAGRITGNGVRPSMRKIGTVGVPLTGEVRIRDNDGRFLETGEVGEIVTRGPSVFDGYLDDPAATNEALADGWFRTGDLGNFDADGFLHLLGRVKEMINCGGVKISPEEIDRVLVAHPAIDQGAAFALPHPTLGEVAAAAVVPAAGAAVTEDALIRYVQSHLGIASAPRKIVFKTSLPMTESGKIQRHKLTASDGQ